jgi:hypothetical protein
MANEVYHNYTTGETLYFCVFKTTGNVFLSNGESDEAWGTGARDADSYDMAMTEAGSSGYYTGDFDASIAVGVYRVCVYLQAGANPADSDLALAEGVMYWDGSAEINMTTLDTTIEDDVIGTGGDTLEDLSDQMDVLSSQKSQVLNVYDDRK